MFICIYLYTNIINLFLFFPLQLIVPKVLSNLIKLIASFLLNPFLMDLDFTLCKDYFV